MIAPEASGSHVIEFLLPRIESRENAYDSSPWNTVAGLGEGVDKELCGGYGGRIAERARDVQERFS